MFSSVVKNSTKRYSNCIKRNFHSLQKNLKQSELIYNRYGIKQLSLRSSQHLCSFTINLCNTQLIRSFSTNQKQLHETRERFKKMFLFLQSGQYSETLNEIEKGYESGYSLPQTDIVMIVSRLTTHHLYDLLNRFIGIIEKYDNACVIQNTPLFCYALLRSNNIKKAFSLITSTSDQYLEQRAEKEEETKNSRFSNLSLLPQEYLFVRICIQLLSDAQGLHNSISPFVQTLPRRHTDETPFTIHYEEVIMCYLYTWQYLKAALQYNGKSQISSSDSANFDFNNENSRSSNNLKELFASPYQPPIVSSRSLDQWTFSSFTLRYGNQRMQSTLRSLELMLWYSYSRSVYDLQSLKVLREHDMGVSKAIETVYEEMKNAFDYWNSGIFQFFIFYYSQPATKVAVLGSTTSQTMRNNEIVTSLLHEMKLRNYCLSTSLALMLLHRNDLSISDFKLIISFYLNQNQSQVKLQTQLTKHQDLFETYLSVLAHRNAGKEIEEFYNQLRYLSLPLTSDLLNQIVLTACYTEETLLRQRVIKDMNTMGIPLYEEVRVCALFEALIKKENIDDYLKGFKDSERTKWLMPMCHMLLQTSHIANKNIISPVLLKQLRQFCEIKKIDLNASCQHLFDYYLEKSDYQNIIILNNYIKQKNIVLPSKQKQIVDDVVKTIQNSRSRLFGRGNLLEMPICTSQFGIELSRQNIKYDDDGTNSIVSNAMNLFKKDETSVSINTILNSAVKTFCDTSIQDYNIWLYLCLFINKQSLKSTSSNRNNHRT